jgi:hypothetical protein
MGLGLVQRSDDNSWVDLDGSSSMQKQSGTCYAKFDHQNPDSVTSYLFDNIFCPILACAF